MTATKRIPTAAQNSVPIVSRKHRLVVQRDRDMLSRLQANENQLGREDQTTLACIAKRGVGHWTEYQSEWIASKCAELGLLVPPPPKVTTQMAPEKDEISAVRWSLPLCPPKAGRRVVFK